MGLYRCLNPDCSEGDVPVFDFEAEHPVCPKCGTDGRTSPRGIAERACVHYLVNDPAGPIRTPNGNRRVACQPLLKKLPRHATGEASAASCPGCLGSAVAKEHVAASVDQTTPITAVPPELSGRLAGGNVVG